MRRVEVVALAVVFVVVVSGCGSVSKVVVRTVTATLKPAAKPSNSSHPSFPTLVANVRSGVIRIEGTSCAGQDVGTGFLVSPTLVATVEHVVDAATLIVLKRNGATLGVGTVIGSDSDRDLALVRASRPIAGHVFRLATRSPALGESVAAFGFPLGLPLTVTRGSVSGLDRTIPINGIARSSLVQTDAAVNPGNSGGPLLSTETDEVVGLVDLGTAAANGISFAVSARVAAPLLQAWRTAPQPVSAASCAGSGSVQTQSGSGGGAAAAAQDPGAVAGMVYGYWEAIRQHDFATAFGYLSSSEQQAVGGQQTFISQHQQDPLSDVSVDVSVASISGGTATVVVNRLQTHASLTGCRDWAGSYSLSFDTVEGWLIDSARLSFTPC